MQINKLRSLKRNKKTILTNPQAAARIQLIQISQFQGQQYKMGSSDMFLHQPDRKYLQQQNLNGLTKTCASITIDRYQKQRQRKSSSIQPKCMRTSKQVINKSALSPIHYTLIDRRVSSISPKIIHYETHQGLKLKLLPKKQKLANLSRISLLQQKYKPRRQGIKSLRGNTVCAIQVKNPKILRKYPSLYYID